MTLPAVAEPYIRMSYESVDYPEPLETYAKRDDYRAIWFLRGWRSYLDDPDYSGPGPEDPDEPGEFEIGDVTGLQTALNSKAGIDDVQEAFEQNTEDWSAEIVRVTNEIMGGAAPDGLNTITELAAASEAQAAALALAEADLTQVIEAEEAARIAALVQEVADRNTAITAMRDALLNGAGPAADTLFELEQLLSSQSGALSALTTLIGTKITSAQGQVLVDTETAARVAAAAAHVAASDPHNDRAYTNTQVSPLVSGLSALTTAITSTVGADLYLAAANRTDPTAVTGGVIRNTSIKTSWSYTQSGIVVPTDSSIGTAHLVDWNATLNDTTTFGPRAQTTPFGPRGVFHVEGILQYGVSTTPATMAPIGFGFQLGVTNALGSNRNITPGWGFMHAPFYTANGPHTLSLRANDTLPGAAAFVDNTTFGAQDVAGLVDGTSLDGGYEAVSFAALPVVGTRAHLHRVIGFQVGNGIVSNGTLGTVDEIIGLRIPYFSGYGGANTIGIVNGSPTVDTPLAQTISAVGNTILPRAGLVVLSNTVGSAATLTSVPTISAGTEGQRLTLVNASANSITLQASAVLAGSKVATGVTIAQNDVIELVYYNSTWMVTSTQQKIKRFETQVLVGGPTTATAASSVTPAGFFEFNLGTDANSVVSVGNLFGSGYFAIGPGGATALDTYLARDSAGVFKVGISAEGMLKSGVVKVMNAQTGTAYDVLLADQSKHITRANAGASTMRWPQDSAAAIPIGTTIEVWNIGAGTITHSANAGATVVGATSQATNTKFTALKTAANTWALAAG